MHLALAHSVTLLHLRSYELLSWSAGLFPSLRYSVGSLCILSLVALSFGLGLLLSGTAAEFVGSWLSFVMCFSVPTFLYNVWRTAKMFDDLRARANVRVQEDMEKHLDSFLDNFLRER